MAGEKAPEGRDAGANGCDPVGAKSSCAQPSAALANSGARPASLISAMDVRAARLSQDRSKYILTLVERDPAAEKTPRRHKFASRDLIGAFSTGTGPARNEKTRRIIAQRFKERREKNR